MSKGEFFMGCDVSKGYSDFVVLDDKENVIEKTLQIDDTFEGHSTLSRFLSAFFKTHEQSILYVGVESTGGYENNWFGLMLRLSEVFNLKVTRLNPLCVKKHHEAAMRRNVTDDISAYNIASYLMAYRSKVNYEQDIAFSSTRKQWKFTRLLIKQKTQLSNQLGFLLYQSQPDLVRYCKNGAPQWIIGLLSKYPTAHDLSRAKTSTVATIPYISIEKAKQLITDAKCSVASSVDETDGFVIKETVRQIESLTIAIESQKTHMEKNCAMPEVNLLSSVKGIGKYSAIGLMINIVSIKRFSDVKKLSSYFSVHPVYRQSGDDTWGYRMSKQGRSEPRAILYMATLSALTCNPVIKKLYKSCLANKMERLVAVGVCMHKMLRIVYGILRTDKEFDSQIDDKNAKKFEKKAENKHQERKRRLQQPDQKAPISRRQTKTREKQKGGHLEPQNKNIIKNGVIPSLPFNKYNKNHKSGEKKITEKLVHIGGILVSEIAELEEICNA